MLLIAATPRSGTHYTAALLQALGLDVPHEAVGASGAASWKHIAPGTFTVKKRFHRARTAEIEDPPFTTILHQTRHPLKVVASMQTLSRASWNYLEARTGADPDDHPVERAARAYIDWNKRIEPRAEWRYQIEMLPEVFPEFCQRAGVRNAPAAPPELPPKAKDARPHRYEPIDWSDLVSLNPELAEELRETAARYGYSD